MVRGKAAIWWIRRDLRLHDNRALQEAAAQGGRVIPLFIHDTGLLRSPLHSGAERRQAFLYGGLRTLDGDLRSRGGRVIVRAGSPVRLLAEVARESGADAVFAEEDYSPYARRRDAAVAACLPLHLLPGVSVHHPRTVHKADGRRYIVFTHFSRMWKTLPLATASDLIRVPELTGRLPSLPSAELPELPLPGHFPPGEAEAHRRFLAFTRGPIFRYAEERDQLGQDGTAALSPYFRFGMLSPREAVAVAHGLATNASPDAARRKGAEVWINELVWREFYMSVLYHFPSVLETAFNPQGVYIRRWVPELERVPGRYIHEPRLMSADLQRQAGCIIGKDYPAPMVERAMARERTLAAYKHAAALCRKH